jgi:hypothetical protein
MKEYELTSQESKNPSLLQFMIKLATRKLQKHRKLRKHRGINPHPSFDQGKEKRKREPEVN